MKVIVKKWCGNDKEMSLASAIEPEYPNEQGLVEYAAGQARLNAECIGRLVEHLVEKGLCDIDEAKTICNVYADIESYVESDPTIPNPEPEQTSPWLNPAPKGNPV
jgi:hypothetical protein